MIEKKRCCCGLLNKTDTLNLLAKLVVVSDFMLALVILIGYLAWFSLFSPNRTWYISYVDPRKVDTMSQATFRKIYGCLLFVMIPVVAGLGFKAKAGFIWWFQDQKRTTFLDYYFASCVFYMTFFF